MTKEPRSHRAQHWTSHDLQALAEAAIGGSDQPLLKPSEGRWVGVLASPMLAASQYLATGVSALPPGLTTPIHSHVAEEIAVILSGSGVIDVDGQAIAVETGSIVFTPSNAPHQTTALESGLTVLWIYAPSGSEDRWLTQ